MRNKKSIYFLMIAGLMVSCLLGQSQSINNKLVAYEMKSEKEMMAYNNKVVAKVTDFYNYLELISDPNIENRVRGHTVSLVRKMFLKDVPMVNFLSKSNERIQLEQLLLDLMMSKNKMSFIISQPKFYLEGSEQNISYNLFVKRKNKEEKYQLKQLYFVNVANKKFGDKNKEVVLINLDEILE